MKRLGLMVLALVAAGCAKPWPDVKPAQSSPLSLGDAEWRVTDHLVVIVDASQTMTQEALLPEARAIAQAVVAGMPPGNVRAKQAPTYEVSLIGFGGADRMASSHNAIDALDAMPEGSFRHRDQVQWDAANLRPLGTPGYTPLADVLGEAGAALHGKSGQAAVVIVSDGLADDPAATLEAGRALVAGHGDGVCIHTVHVGEDASGRGLMGELAGLSPCGSARDAASVRDASGVQNLERAVFVAAAPQQPRAVAPADPCAQRIVLRGVQFAFDSAEIRPESAPVLDVAVEQLRECQQIELAIEGHTCSMGTDAYNQGLSERRAASVRQYLVDKGIGAQRLTSRGLGEGSPVASNDSEDGRAQNRRVELVPSNR